MKWNNYHIHLKLCHCDEVVSSPDCHTLQTEDVLVYSYLLQTSNVLVEWKKTLHPQTKNLNNCSTPAFACSVGQSGNKTSAIRILFYFTLLLFYLLIFFLFCITQGEYIHRLLTTCITLSFWIKISSIQKKSDDLISSQDLQFSQNIHKIYSYYYKI